MVLRRSVKRELYPSHAVLEINDLRDFAEEKISNLMFTGAEITQEVSKFIRRVIFCLPSHLKAYFPTDFWLHLTLITGYPSGINFPDKKAYVHSNFSKNATSVKILPIFVSNRKKISDIFS